MTDVGGRDSDYDVPIDDMRYQYPYTGNGFVASTDGRIIPEYYMNPSIIPEGSELWEVNSNGWVPRYTYHNGNWE